MTFEQLIRALALSALVSPGLWGPALAQENALGSNVQGLLEYARAQSPELAAMRQEADAAQQRVQPAGALPDPLLRVELMNISGFVNETKYTLMQPLPGWGKRDLKRDAAAADATRGRRRRSASAACGCVARPGAARGADERERVVR